MMRRGPCLLSFAKANTICKGIVPIGDEVYLYMERLKEAKYSAFLPRNEFIESFAQDESELALHRRCVVELAKTRLGSRSVILATDDDQRALIFRSPFIEQLEAQRDKENGVPYRDLEKRYSLAESGWRMHYDPCLRRRVLAGLDDRERYKNRFERMLNDEWEAFQRDVSIHSTGLGKLPYTFDRAGRYAFYSAVMEICAEPLGFQFDKTKSRRDYPVFSKEVTEFWDLCWSLEGEGGDDLFYNPFEGRFAISFALRRREAKGGLEDAKRGEVLRFEWRGIVPGFSNGYWKFWNLDDLETAIRAHLFHYSFIAPTLEKAVQRVLINSNGEP